VDEGVMRQSYAEKISIPRDLSVIGFGDIRLAQFVLPPLTTVRMSQSELARLAFHALLSDVQRHTPAPKWDGVCPADQPGVAGVHRAGARFAGACAAE
jgi:DNA-binding LacI/PurR family transcriptional regulator